MIKLFAAAGALAFVLGAAPGCAAELLASVRDNHGKPVADAIILATPLDPGTAQHAKPQTVAVDQLDKQFVPYVKAVYVGSKVRFPNSDNIRHQVYSFSPAKRFELPLYAGSSAPPVLFDKPGVVVLGCNIHDWMLAYVYVSETPYFAKTEAAGTAVIDDMPPGEYSVRVWHPSMEHGEETTVRRLIVSADAPAKAEWDLILKASLRVPRVSGAASTGYP